jgi:hypothetical protein
MELLWLLYGGLALTLAFYFPGWLILHSLGISKKLLVPASYVTGMVLWGYQGTVFGYINFRQGTYLYLILTSLIWLVLNRNSISTITTSFQLKRLMLVLSAWIKRYPVFLLLAATGIFIQVATVWPMGSLTDKGMLFCCRGVPDSVYHLALTNRIIHEFPPEEPGAAGIIVRNYHYWSNTVIADLVRIFGLPLIPTSFRLFPIFLSVMLATSLYSFSRLLKVPRMYLSWLTLFVFFHGDLVFILRALVGHGFNFEIQFLDDASKLLAGIPRAFSTVVLFWILPLFLVWLKKRSIRFDMALALIIASLVGFKFYTFAFMVFGLIALGMYWLITKQFAMLRMPIFAAIFSFMIYWPVNGQSENGIYFHPPWIISHFIEKPGMGLEFLELRRQIFSAHNNVVQLALHQVYSIALYGIFVFGVLNLSFIPVKLAYQQLPKEFHILCISGILLSLLFGYFSSQTNGGLNTMQFSFNFLYVGSIYAAFVLTKVFSSNLPAFWLAPIAFIIVGLTSTRVIHEGLQNFGVLAGRQEEYISPDELEALSYLKSLPLEEGVIIVPNEYALEQMRLHINLLTNKPIYVVGYYGVLYDHNIVEGKERLDFNDSIYISGNIKSALRKLGEIKAIYSYAPVNYQLQWEKAPDQLKLVFNNQTVSIVEVSHEE